jgi:hypothetical protein
VEPTAGVHRRAALLVVALLLAAAPAVASPEPQPAQAPTATATTADSDNTNEYRFTAYPSYPLTEKLTGFGYIGYVTNPESGYYSGYLGTGTFYQAKKHVQLWLGLITVGTNKETASNTLELRPFTGVKFMGINSKKWRYYNWTRYEIRFTDTVTTGDWTTVHRFRNQSRIDFPLASLERVWQPKTFYAWTDVEPIWRSDSGRIDPLRWRTGLGYIVNPHLIAELQYYAQWTQPDSAGLRYTGNIIRLNFKIMTKRGLLPQKALRSLLDNNIDE